MSSTDSQASGSDQGQLVRDVQAGQAEATCGNCRWWALNEAGGEIGECRREQPKIYFRSGKPPGTAWPQTIATDWCGEFEAAHLPNRVGIQPAEREARITAEAVAAEL